MKLVRRGKPTAALYMLYKLQTANSLSVLHTVYLPAVTSQKYVLLLTIHSGCAVYG